MSNPSTNDPVSELAGLLRGRRTVVLTGAGCSTESGIPDYRGEGSRERAKNPMQWRSFRDDAVLRRRYWARAFVGWERFGRARPNEAHLALAELESRGAVRGIITQNVDRLHRAAGSKKVVELHGALAEVRCLGCGAFEDRDSVQRRLAEKNPGWLASTAELAPDGDAELGQDFERFVIVACQRCGGVIRPNVVFFGEGVPRPILESAWAVFDEADVLLVVGSSLAVFSGFRFVKKAASRAMPVGIVNRGETRGDPSARVLVDGRAGHVLPRLLTLLE